MEAETVEFKPAACNSTVLKVEPSRDLRYHLPTQAFISSTISNFKSLRKLLIQNEFTKPLEYWKSQLKTSPKPSVCCYLDQSSILLLLQEPNIPSIWIFTLLIYIDPLLTCDEISILRELAFRYLEFRKESRQILECNLIVTIICYFFEQFDFKEYLDES